MNKTIKEAMVHRYYYESQAQEHLQTFIDAYNFAKILKTLKGLTPWEFIVDQRKSKPELFKINLEHYKMGLNK